MNPILFFVLFWFPLLVLHEAGIDPGRWLVLDGRQTTAELSDAVWERVREAVSKLSEVD